MVAELIFGTLLSVAAALYVVLFCLRRGFTLALLAEKLLESAGLDSSSRSRTITAQVELNSTSAAAAPVKQLRGPTSFPLIGSLHHLGGPGGPFEAFTRLSEKYGEIYEMQLGVAKCVIVSSYPLIKEVLITKGGHFGGRPDFLRFHHLFGGDRNNSLALCDWSDLQRKRRSIARSFCSPRGGSSQQEEISRVAVDEIGRLFQHLDSEANAGVRRGELPVKPIILAAVGNMFTKYMCSKRFGYEEPGFDLVVRTFDKIFWDINQGYALDFLPWLKPLYAGHLRRLGNWAGDIRGFILKRIIEPRREALLARATPDDSSSAGGSEQLPPRDFTDALLLHHENSDSELSWQHILFELEDFLGGHSAVGNLVMMVLANCVLHPEVQRKIQAECDALLRGEEPRGEGRARFVSPSDRLRLPYTEAAIYETLRISSSPIVPHVATCATDIGGYRVEPGTVVFLNNYGLNLGEEHWGADAKQFKPERFLKPQAAAHRSSQRRAAEDESDGGKESAGSVEAGAAPALVCTRPEFFVPFSTGKRTCIGQKLVQGFAFVILTMLLRKYDVSAPPGVDVRKYLQPSCLALPPNCFNLVFTHREH